MKDYNQEVHDLEKRAEILKQQIDVLIHTKTTLEAKIQKQEEKLFSSLALEACLKVCEGEPVYIVKNIGYVPRVELLSQNDILRIKKRDSAYFELHKTLDGEVRWVQVWGSNLDRNFIIVPSKEAALQVAKMIVAEKIEATGNRPNRDFYDVAKELGVSVPEEYEKIILAEKEKSLQGSINYHEGCLKNAKEKLQEFEERQKQDKK